MTTGKSYKLCVDLDGMDLMFISAILMFACWKQLDNV